MSGAPPKNVEASELWVKLSERPRPTTTIDFPSRDAAKSPGKLALRILTELELHTCRANADKVAKNFVGNDTKLGDLGYEDIYNNELSAQLVSMAARDANDPQVPAFPSAKAASQKLTTDEIAQIVQAYSYWRKEAGPMLSEMTPAEMEAWIKLLREGGSRIPLARLSGEALTDLVMYLVSKATLPTDSGSAGSQQDGPSTVTDLAGPGDVT